MKRWSSIAVVLLFVCACVASVVTGCSFSDGPSQSTSGKLSTTSDILLWGPDSGTITIPYCFVTDVPSAACFDSGAPSPPATISSAELAVYSNAIEHSWSNAERIKLQYTGKCDRVNDSSQKVVIWVWGIADSHYNNSGQSNVGAPGATVNAVSCPVDANIIIYSNGLMAYSKDTMNAVMVHELGHSLGWQHEQDQDAGLSDPANGDSGACYPPGSWDGGVFYPDYTHDNMNNVFFTAYDPDSIMNYCRSIRGYDGRLSDLDIAGLQVAYGAVDQMTKDSDGDGYKDFQDNCPYVVNASQDDSNFEAEVQVQIGAGYTGDDGHRPTTSDTTAYIKRWHTAYAGDACDPVVANRGASVGWVNSNARTSSQCWDVKVGGTGYHQNLIAAPSGSYPIRYNSLMQFNGAVGGPAGFSGKQNGKNAPSFCECYHATDSTPSIRALCNGGTFNCTPGDDHLFPALDNSTVPGSYLAIHTEIHSLYWQDVFFSQLNMAHVDPMPGYNPNPINKLWSNAADLTTFAFPAFPDGGNVANSDHPIGMFWTQIQSFPYNLVNLHADLTGATPMPTDGGAPYVPNLQNVYVGTDAAWDYGVCQFAVVAPFSYRWMRVPYCDPTPVPATYGMIQHMVATPGNIILGTDVSGAVTEMTSSFTTNALTALSSITSGTWEELAADDRVSGQARDDTGPNAILVDTGTTRIEGAFTRSGARIDEQQPATHVGTQSTTALRTYAAGANRLYSVEQNPASGQWQFVARNVSDALAGTSTVATTTLGSSVFASPQAVAYSRTTKLVYLVDSVLSGRSHYWKLMTIDPSSGTLSTLWQSGVYAGTVPTATLSTTTDGEILVGFTGKGDGLYHVLHMDTAGRPWHSTSGSGSLYSAAVGHSGSITIPLVQTVTSTQLNASFSNVGWDSMTTGACGSTWLQTTFGRDVLGATGALQSGMVCQPISDGGFESGTFHSWTATGQSETISTSAHSGTHSAMLGATTPTNGDSSVQQTFVVPARGGSLSFWYSNVCPDTVTYDWFTATLLNAGGSLLTTIVPKTCATSSAWTQATLDLTSWAGQTVTVVLTSHDDNYPGDATYSFVDDVSVQ